MNNLIFFGELPNKAIHGISISNKINLDVLKKKYTLYVVQENVDLKYFNRIAIFKIYAFLNSLIKIALRSLKLNEVIFYTVLSVSLVGSIKTLLSILAFKLFSPKSKVFVHVHRGDLSKRLSSSIILKFIIEIVINISYKIIYLHDDFAISENKVILENTIVPETESKLKSINFPVNKKEFVFLSNYIEEKGFYLVLNVFNNLGYYKLSCYGSAVSNNSIDDIVLLSSSNVKINSTVNENKKIEILKKGKILLFPSFNEGMPLVILEAMCSGNIVIVSNVGVIKDMVGHDYPFILKTISEDAILEMINIMENYTDDELKKISNDLKNRYNKFFSNKRHNDKLLNIFKM